MKVIEVMIRGAVLNIQNACRDNIDSMEGEKRC